MVIINIRTGLSKTISLEDYNSNELYKIYKFYKYHKDFTVLTKF